VLLSSSFCQMGASYSSYPSPPVVCGFCFKLSFAACARTTGHNTNVSVGTAAPSVARKRGQARGLPASILAVQLDFSSGVSAHTKNDFSVVVAL
jgi:hypothetical protein